MTRERGVGRCVGGGESGIGTAPSGIDGDDLTAAPTDQEDPVQTLSEDLQEFHVWERSVKETIGGRYFINIFIYIILYTYYTILYLLLLLKLMLDKNVPSCGGKVALQGKARL